PVRLVWKFIRVPGSFLLTVNNTFSQYSGLLITIVCILVMIGVSYASPAPAYDKISGLTFSTMTEEDRRRTRASWTAKDVVTSALLLVFIMIAYLYFTG